MRARHRLTLLADGSSDGILLRPIQWLLTRAGYDLELRWTSRPSGGNSQRVQEALRCYPCEILVVHRDAEREELDTRRQEIARAVESAEGAPPFVCLVPVRMTEAWFLFDEGNLRRSAGNPNGKDALDLPKLRSVEGLVNPKQTLYDALIAASGLRGRRAKNFQPRDSVIRLAELIQDYSPLLELSAFKCFADELLEGLKRLPAS